MKWALEACDYFDITPTIHSGLAVFPGDTPFRQEFIYDMTKGDGFTLSKIECTVHLGAHTDAPNHYSKSGDSLESRSLNYYMGATQVIDVSRATGSRIKIEDLAKKQITAKRVLFKTGTFPNPDQWTDKFSALSAPLVHFLAEHGVVLVGIDTPSIDPAHDAILESHNAVLKNDMAILEGIVLDDVPEGIYQLIALPLKIAGSDASPVRAILLKERK